MDCEQNLIPEVGMGVTYHIGSDSYPGTITKVSPSKKVFWYKRDNFYRTKNTDLQTENQTFVYTTNPKAKEERAFLNKRGVWKATKNVGYLTLGQREAYLDPSF